MRRTALVLASVVLAGCGGDGGRAEAVDTATRWLDAVAERDAGAACALMAPSAVEALRGRGGAGRRANCVAVVRAYRDAFPQREMDAILAAGLEAEGAVKDGQVGVFPVSGRHELQVVLMRKQGDAWRVASSNLAP